MESDHMDKMQEMKSMMQTMLSMMDEMMGDEAQEGPRENGMLGDKLAKMRSNKEM